MTSNLDRPLGDLIKANKKKSGGQRQGGRPQQGGIAKGKKQQNRQAGTNQPRRSTGNQTTPAKKKPRQQAKQTPVKQMAKQGRQARQNVTQNRQVDQRQKKLDQRRGLAPIIPTTQPMLVYIDAATGQQIAQPVAVVQQPGQHGAQVIPTGAPQRSKPLFKAANRQANQPQNGGRRQSAGQGRGSGNQRQAQRSGNQRQNQRRNN